MSRHRVPVTAAIRVLRDAKIAFLPVPYDYVEGGGTGHFAAEIGVDEHRVIKTLVMEDETGAPLVVLMHGDREVSTRELARRIGVKQIRPCRPDVADRHSGYKVGGTSPFGTRRRMPVYYEAEIAALPRIYINGGKRGLILEMEPGPALALLGAVPVEVARA